MNNQLFESFQTAYRNLELQPLIDQKDLDKFRVEYCHQVIEELQQLVEDSPAADSKIMFTGHRGCGKSTLLAEFSKQCKDKYFVVLFSIADTIEMSDVNHINILFAIAVNLMKEADKHNLQISKSAKDTFYKWFAEHTQTEINTINAEISIDFDLIKIIAGKLKTDAIVREEIKLKFQRRVTELIARINEIAAIIQAAAKKEIIVIIDDLDKLELGVVNEIYKDNIKALCSPGFHIIYTIPIAALRDKFLKPIIETETNDQVVAMPVLKLFAKGDSRQLGAIPRDEVINLFSEILNKRIAKELLEVETQKKLIVYSGGVLRELIRITNECCRICLRLIRRHQEPIINNEILEEAINDLRNDYALPLGKVDYEILQIIYNKYMPDDPKQSEFLELLHGLHILEYRNRQIWYDVHPIIVELLRDRGLSNGS